MLNLRNDNHLVSPVFLCAARVGLKGPTGTLFFIFSNVHIFFIVFPLYILVYKKNETRKKKIPTSRLAFSFCPPGAHEENIQIFHAANCMTIDHAGIPI